MRALVCVLGLVAAHTLITARDVLAGDHPAPAVMIVDPFIRLVRTGGFWERGEAYGHFRVLVRRSAADHPHDQVMVQVLRVIDDETIVVDRAIEIDTPMLAGYVHDVSMVRVGRTAVSLTVIMDMKAMEGVQLTAAFLVTSDGRVKQIQSTTYFDIDEWLNENAAAK